MTNDSSKKKHIVIVGAGIVGVSTAIWLQRSGHAVTIIDRKGPAEGTSYGNGGVLASCAILPVTMPGLLAKAPAMLFDPDQPLFLKWSYLPRLLPWLVPYLRQSTPAIVRRTATALYGLIGDSLADHQALAAGTSAEKWLVPCDYLYAYRDRADFDADRFGWSIRREYGFEWEEMSGEAFRAYDPVFSPDLDFAVRMKNHGRIADPGQYVKDLARDFERKGGRVVLAEVTDIVRQDGCVRGIRAAGEMIACDQLVIAAGVWSTKLTALLGLKIPLESERGYHLELIEPNFMPRSPVMINAGKFVATPMEGRLRLAGIIELGGLDAPPSRAPFDLLMRKTMAAMPELTFAGTREWMGHRPATVDSIPLIGPVPGVSGAWLGFGHHHIGLTGGPKTGRLLSQMIDGRMPNLDVAPYAPMRFQ